MFLQLAFCIAAQTIDGWTAGDSEIVISIKASGNVVWHSKYAFIDF